MMLVTPTAATETQVATTAIGPLAITNEVNRGGFTIVSKYLPGVFRSGGDHVRLTLRGPSASGASCAISNITISLVATSAGSNPYDSASTPTAVTFGGGSSLILARNSNYVSDKIAFAIDLTKPVLIAYNIAAGTQATTYAFNLTQQYCFYVLAAKAEAGSTARTAGYAGRGSSSAFLTSLECFN